MDIRTRPISKIKDFEWVPRNLDTRYARINKPLTLVGVFIALMSVVDI